MPQIEIRTGDLLDQTDVEVIVNAWNRNFIPWWLLLPSGVSGAIKKRGGYAPFRELRRFGILRPGDAVVTGPGRLPFKAIIHVAALSTFWTSSEAIIRRCTANALAACVERDFASVALPLIGSGTGGVSPSLALEVMQEEAARHSFSGRVVLVEFSRL
jgi:O-acetyl-ADP-ribose deacetylase (regulator of RNase III)